MMGAVAVVRHSLEDDEGGDHGAAALGHYGDHDAHVRDAGGHRGGDGCLRVAQADSHQSTCRGHCVEACASMRMCPCVCTCACVHVQVCAIVCACIRVYTCVEVCLCVCVGRGGRGAWGCMCFDTLIGTICPLRPCLYSAFAATLLFTPSALPAFKGCILQGGCKGLYHFQPFSTYQPHTNHTPQEAERSTVQPQRHSPPPIPAGPSKVRTPSALPLDQRWRDGARSRTMASVEAAAGPVS